MMVWVLEAVFGAASAAVLGVADKEDGARGVLGSAEELDGLAGADGLLLE